MPSKILKYILLFIILIELIAIVFLAWNLTSDQAVNNSASTIAKVTISIGSSSASVLSNQSLLSSIKSSKSSISNVSVSASSIASSGSSRSNMSSDSSLQLSSSSISSISIASSLTLSTSSSSATSSNFDYSTLLQRAATRDDSGLVQAGEFRFQSQTYWLNLIFNIDGSSRLAVSESNLVNLKVIPNNDLTDVFIRDVQPTPDNGIFSIFVASGQGRDPVITTFTIDISQYL